MTAEKVRSYLAIIITTGTLLTASILALEEVFTGKTPNLAVLKNWASLWTGILGVILGYYFGRK